MLSAPEDGVIEYCDCHREADKSSWEDIANVALEVGGNWSRRLLGATQGLPSAG